MSPTPSDLAGKNAAFHVSITTFIKDIYMKDRNLLLVNELLWIDHLVHVFPFNSICFIINRKFRRREDTFSFEREDGTTKNLAHCYPSTISIMQIFGGEMYYKFYKIQ